MLPKNLFTWRGNKFFDSSTSLKKVGSSYFGVCGFLDFTERVAKSALDILYLNMIFLFCFPYQIFKFFAINFSYFVIRIFLNSSMAKSDNKIQAGTDKKDKI